MASIEKFSSNLKSLAQRIAIEKERILTESAEKVNAEMQRRIYERGQAANGSRIGSYSNEPIYIKTPVKQVKNSRFRRVGKTGKKTKSTTYFKGGYKEFRQKAGRRSDTVNLDLTGSLRVSQKVAKYKGGRVIYFDQPVSIKKARGNEERFKKRIFTLSEAEKELFYTTVSKELQRIINKELS